MSTVLQSKPVSRDSLAEKLGFQQKLQAVTNKIHATKNIDEIILELSQELCNLFNADRLTIYLTSEDRGSIISKVKTGLNSFKDIKLPINEQSIAGFVACNKRMVNIRDVYDDVELKSYSPQLNFLKAVDAKTGYRTKQMLVAPVLEAKTKELIGVVQIINSKAGQPFPPHDGGGRGAAMRDAGDRVPPAPGPDDAGAHQVRRAGDQRGDFGGRAGAGAALGAAQEPRHGDGADRGIQGQAPGAGRGARGLFRRALRAVQGRTASSRPISSRT